jgi:hypothetical protein
MIGILTELMRLVDAARCQNRDMKVKKKCPHFVNIPFKRELETRGKQRRLQ